MIHPSSPVYTNHSDDARRTLYGQKRTLEDNLPYFLGFEGLYH